MKLTTHLLKLYKYSYCADQFFSVNDWQLLHQLPANVIIFNLKKQLIIIFFCLTPVMSNRLIIIFLHNNALNGSDSYRLCLYLQPFNHNLNHEHILQGTCNIVFNIVHSHTHSITQLLLTGQVIILCTYRKGRKLVIQHSTSYKSTVDSDFIPGSQCKDDHLTVRKMRSSHRQ